jgi:hypothetical protein
MMMMTGLVMHPITRKLSRQGEVIATTHFSPPVPTMSNFTPQVARQALRIASRRYPSSAFPRISSSAAALNASGRRSYVSETKPSNATVNVDTTIKADQKAFLRQTGQRAEDATMPTTGMGADAMLSPSAGSSCLAPVVMSTALTHPRPIEADNHNG